MQHSDSLQVNVCFTSTVDTVEVDFTEDLDDETDDKENGGTDQSERPERSPRGSSPPKTNGEEEIFCSKESKNKIQMMGVEDLEKFETFCKEKASESISADRMETGQNEIHVYENVTDYSSESGSKVNKMATDSIDSNDEKNTSEDPPDVLLSKVTDAEAEHIYSELETDGETHLKPIGEGSVDNDEEIDDENVFSGKNSTLCIKERGQ